MSECAYCLAAVPAGSLETHERACEAVIGEIVGGLAGEVYADAGLTREDPLFDALLDRVIAGARVQIQAMADVGAHIRESAATVAIRGKHGAERCPLPAVLAPARHPTNAVAPERRYTPDRGVTVSDEAQCFSGSQVAGR